MLKELRKQADKTQQELADEIGVASETVSRWENGHHKPTGDMYVLLCESLGCSIKELSGAIKTTFKE